MAETNLKRGDVIKLKSGSCLMTVSHIETDRIPAHGNKIQLPDNHITVEYFWEGQIKTAKLYESMIIKN